MSPDMRGSDRNNYIRMVISGFFRLQFPLSVRGEGSGGEVPPSRYPTGSVKTNRVPPSGGYSA